MCSLCSVFSEGILKQTFYTWRWNLSSKGGKKTTGTASYCGLQLGKSEESAKSKLHPSIHLSSCACVGLWKYLAQEC
ncbi:hypothetical protein CHARACLAT_002962 [Characodon lateralis]|uniref:Uncharacterized protein n=1 Tax=Characodon lateralis TaxID=208331 RepID=A0ABU7EQT8_9TELE|nr:hypothetical protein [Characodon lateralis]